MEDGMQNLGALGSYMAYMVQFVCILRGLVVE
ncbi:hypothetical protein SAMN04488023_1616 [Pedobacter rhizosphaerae]|uniref:Uncharacterized protein n=1 Tax=Pedobacter rhizosphaerae TaxID=390241 RepID=A0A1H9W7Q4_9SPHI|nr:hypothetical protein SAMN04488023_1616 [Pedobacter rhizosphaerae]